jgi:hypothetical protein
VVLGTLAVLSNPVQLTTVLRLQVISLGGEQVLGVQARLDAFGELDLLSGVEEGDFPDLLEIVLDGVGGGAGGDDLLRRLIGLIGVRNGERAVLVPLPRLAPRSLGRGLLRLLAADAVELPGQGGDRRAHLDALDDPTAEDEAIARQELAGDDGVLLLGDHEAGHWAMAVGGQRNGFFERAVARELEPFDGGAAAHVQGRPGGEPDPFESGRRVKGLALGAVAVGLQAHVQVVVP